MCHDDKIFTSLNQIKDPIDVMLGDGHALTGTAIGRGEVVLDMVLPNGACESKSCTLHDDFYVPKLTYNLISVTKASQTGKIVKFTKIKSTRLDKKHKICSH